MRKPQFSRFFLQQRVHKPKGYPFPGTYIGSVWTTKGEERVIVEHDDGWIHIFNSDEIEAAPEK
jgi:hypothetical protein